MVSFDESDSPTSPFMDHDSAGVVARHALSGIKLAEATQVHSVSASLSLDLARHEPGYGVNDDTGSVWHGVWSIPRCG